MTPSQILFLSLCLAFTWVDVLKRGVTKPFNCTKCMTGWIALGFGLYFYHWGGWVFLFEGLFIGAMFEAIKFRWL